MVELVRYVARLLAEYAACAVVRCMVRSKARELGLADEHADHVIRLWLRVLRKKEEDPAAPVSLRAPSDEAPPSTVRAAR